jgi:hypothetical protein
MIMHTLPPIISLATALASDSLSKRRFCQHGRQIAEGGDNMFVIIVNTYEKT